MSGPQNLPDKWQVVRTSSGNNKARKAEPGKGLFKPVPISKSTFESLDDENSEDVSTDEWAGGDKLKKRSLKGKKGKNPSPDVKPQPPDPIVLDFAKLAGSIALCRTKFPDNDLLLLQEVANFLRMDADFAGALKLCPAGNTPTGACEEFAFPLKHLTPQQLLELRTIVGSVHREEAYCKFIEYAVDEMTTAFAKGDSLLSHRLCLQLISIERPEVYLTLSEKYAHLLKSSKNNMNTMVAMMAVFAQAGVGSLSVGLHVWFSVMLPTIQLPNLSSLMLMHCERLLAAYSVLPDWQLPPSSTPQTLRPAFDLLVHSLQDCQPFNPPPNYEVFAHEVAVSPHHFFRLFDIVYPVNSSTGKVSQVPWMSRLSPAQKRQLATLCYKIKVLLMKFGDKCCASTMFPSFLIRFNEGLPVYIKKELLSNLLGCLHCDQGNCCTAWLGTCSRYPANAGYLSQCVAENMSPFFAEYAPDAGKLRKTLKQVNGLAAAAGGGANGSLLLQGDGDDDDDDDARGKRPVLWSVWVLLRTVVTLAVLALVADLLFANCDPSAMATGRLLRRYPHVQHQAELWRRRTTAWLYPTCSRLFSGLAPYSLAFGQRVYTTSDKAARTARLWYASHGQSAVAHVQMHAAQTEAFLVSYGVDIRTFVYWFFTTAIPWLCQHFYEACKVAVAHLDKTLVPWLRQHLPPLPAASAPDNDGL